MKAFFDDASGASASAASASGASASGASASASAGLTPSDFPSLNGKIDEGWIPVGPKGKPYAKIVAASAPPSALGASAPSKRAEKAPTVSTTVDIDKSSWADDQVASVTETSVQVAPVQVAPVTETSAPSKEQRLELIKRLPIPGRLRMDLMKSSITEDEFKIAFELMEADEMVEYFRDLLGKGGSAA